MFYGLPQNYCIIGLLPGYLERQNSSLVAMMNTLIEKSENENSGFYLYDLEQVYRILARNEMMNQPTLLLGVTYALLDLAENCQMKLRNTIIMETGGMKGKRKEMTREEVHAFIKEKLGVSQVHSEYGMTELLSQAYSNGNGRFQCPPWMKVMLRDPYDPLTVFESTRTDKPSSGLINIIDLANIYSCSFIATDDVGKLYKNGIFEVTGRSDTSLVRGCNLLVM